MLSPEQAQERLKEFRLDNEPKERQAAAAALPGELGKAGQLLFKKSKDGQDWQSELKWISEAAQILDQQEPADRMQLFATLFPGLEKYIEGAWQLQITRLPYQSGWQRKAFRIPHNPEITRLTRTQWLIRLFGLLAQYRQDITWFAAWAAYLNRWGGAPHELGVVLAAAIESGDAQGQEVFDILLASANGEHEIGAMGRHVIRALLIADRPDGWDFVEKLLIAAQRQEGLRQVILESIDECHPQAFRRLVRLMLDQNLLRFSAAVRAVDVWFGLGWNVEDIRTVQAFLERLSGMLGDPQVVEQALKGEDGEALYLALWVLAVEDAERAMTAASPLLSDPAIVRRFAAVHLLGQLGLLESKRLLLPMLADEDLRIVARALASLRGYYATENSELAETDLFERIEALLPRLNTKAKALQPIIWPWMAVTLDRESVADQLLGCLGDRSPKRLIPYLTLMSTYGRQSVAKVLREIGKQDTEVRETLFSLLGDPGRGVREEALAGIAGLSITDEEAVELEGLLHRKASDLRRAVLSLLLKRKDLQVLDSAERLMQATNEMSRLAGLELLRLMIDDNRQPEECRTQARVYQADQARLSVNEETLLKTILREPEKVATLDDALGLLSPTDQTPPVRPEVRERSYITKAAIACVEGLDALVQQYSRTPVTFYQWTTTKEELLGNLPWHYLQTNPQVPIEENIARLPLREVWEEWWAARPADLRDEDGLELVRALVLTPIPVIVKRVKDPSVKKVAEIVLNGGDWEGRLKYPQLVGVVVTWLLRLHPPAGAADFLLDAAETSFALIPEDDLGRLAEKPAQPRYYGEDTASDLWWRSSGVILTWVNQARLYRKLCPSSWHGDHYARLWQLLRWADAPGVTAFRFRPAFDEVLDAFGVGAATEADLTDHLLGPRSRYVWASGFQTYGYGFGDLQDLSRRKPDERFARYPVLKDVIDRCRKRIVEVECTRGDMPTAASEPAKYLRAVFGIDALVKLVTALGRGNFLRGWSYDGASKETVLSHLIRVALPLETDTIQEFARQVAEAKISRGRLIDLAVYAPQWARYVEHVLDWPGLAEAVWWIHAHTKDPGWRVDAEVRELWNAETSERTPLSPQDLIDGAVDVAWFHRVYDQLGAERWKALYASAKYASGGLGHARATLFADAMLGNLDKQVLLDRIAQKRHQDSVRALGLLPLAQGDDAEADVLDRYESIQEFMRTSKQFGSMRQANEKLAAGIAMQNLARTAGYPDPIRLEWAMEARANADMAGGSLAATVEDVIVTLAIDAWGEPGLSVEKQGKVLKSIPPKMKKDPAIVHLLERKKDIKRQTSRMRQSLEGAMCRGDIFTPAELRSLMSHPILAPMLEQLTFVSSAAMGYPVEGGKALQNHDGSTIKIGKKEQLRIAHPHDLLASGQWHEWQRECFLAERIQPFKQVFRELYVLTETEKTEGNFSRRYAGHQVQPKQAAALLGQRGWVMHPEEGVRRTFHEANISVWLSGLMTFLSPAEMEGETLEGVHFARRGEWQPLPLEEVPPRIFSEAMRDIDLIVSVAHVGGVDPEASASTVEMRASLVRETCRLLKVGNARVERSHVLIDGKLGNYSVHLGSAIVHRQPGGAVCIIPVHSQHRGRLFLPFADDDPRTAEVVSKVILLARDNEIKDPTILEQLLIAH